MNVFIVVARRLIVMCGACGLFALSVQTTSAEELSERMAAASRAADEAHQAADAALAAAKAADGTGGDDLVASLVKQALRAAEAAKAAANAATQALAAAQPSGTSSAVAVRTADATAMPYTEHVQCQNQKCQIDLWLTRGFRAFSQCQVCHGLDANGSSFAPSLVEKLKEIDEPRFVEVVTNGFKGQVGVMPGWKENPNVMKYLDPLYAYLKARSDGAIPAGKLPRFDR